jgi:hypothetical protein
MMAVVNIGAILEYGKNLEPSSEGLGDLVQKSEDQLQLEEVCKLKRKLP